MQKSIIALTLILICASCSKFSTPKSAAKNIEVNAFKAAQRGDVAGCENAFKNHVIGRNNDGTYSDIPSEFFKDECSSVPQDLDSQIKDTHYETIFNDGKNAIVRVSGKGDSYTIHMIKSKNGWVWLLR